ncbi:MAG TPA: efflux RND transporter permease subunit [Terriglobia bacterium]|nr:efflux RND transporter permease subunit [Terriglobia bacterium]
MRANETGFAGRVAHFFINSKLTPLFIVFAVLLGVFAVIETPREEEPQIIVPMMDVFVQMPGASAHEVEERVTSPMEKLIWEIPGVEYVYSTTRPGLSMVVVRYKVGEKEEDSIVKLYNKLYSHFDLIPPGASKPLIQPRSIDDVPILALTLWSARYDSYTLRRVAAQIEGEIKNIDDVSQTQIIGGERRQISVLLDPARMAALSVAPATLVPAIEHANQRLPAGEFASANQEFAVQTGEFLRSADDVGAVVVGVSGGHPVYLRDVATIRDGPEEPANYVLFGFGNLGASPVGDPGNQAETTAGTRRALAGITGDSPAVTIAISKRKGKNAVVVADRVLEKIEKLKGTVIPPGIQVTVTRDYGDTAQEKSNELLKHLLLATLSVTVLIALALGWRSSIVVLAAVPVTLALTLFVYFIFGYTLNRVTLFALIFSIGILVDDAIVVVENITRHFHLPENKNRPLADVAVEAVDEVGNPTALATWAVIAAILPMAFVGGLMGPYMRPIPVGASVAMLLSLFIAFVVSPWAGLRMLAGARTSHTETETGRESWTTRLYRRVMTPLLLNPTRRWTFLAGVVFLLLAALMLPVLKIVRVKMLPFDNKSEMQVIIDMPDGTTLEQTTRVAREVARRIAQEPEVLNYQIYAGTSGPYNFNGLVRHYFLRRGPNRADIQVNLVGKGDRAAQSHEIAKRVRLAIDPIGEKYGARLKVAEIPPGPPVIETLVAEVYGPDYTQQTEVARQIRDIFKKTPGVVDVDWLVEDPQTEYRFVVDKEKAALNGIDAQQVAETLRLALSGAVVGLAHQPKEKEDVDIVLRLPRAQRASLADLGALRLVSATGAMVPLSELTRVEQGAIETSIYHKNLKPVVYVTGDVAGREESPVYAIQKLSKELDSLRAPAGYVIERYATHMPFTTDRISMKWDGEWQITYEVFRDLGFAFAVVMVLIYVIVVAWFQSFRVPLVIMAPIPLTLIGILPAHALLGAFITATSFIGFIAGAGIIVRNSIILVDFIELRLRQGIPLEEAVIDAGAVRFRPMLLTAAAVVVGAFVILFDPIFQGLAISLMAGEVASTFLSRLAVPVLYYLHARGNENKISGGSPLHGTQPSGAVESGSV